MTKKIKKRGKIKIIGDRCKGCGYCIISCSKGCLSKGVELNAFGYIPPLFIRPNDCTACKSCAIMCPEIAIEIYCCQNNGN
ncbi:MAG: ferredoxin family protein [Thermodesulfovibrionales bacterium]|nr:ferredoxin family protein [Thermodesulfovibrionales bacterium]